MRKLLILSIIVLSAFVGGIGCAYAATKSHHKDERQNIIEENSAELPEENEAQQLLESLPPFVWQDTLPALPMSLLIYSELIYEPEPLYIDTVVTWQRIRPALFPEELTNPRWLSEARTRWNTARLLQQRLMTGPAHRIDYFAWELPDPPQLQPITEAPVLPTISTIPDALPSLGETPEEVIRPRHWLHVVALGLQFSQAFVSPNWYQGGDNSLTLLSNLRWNVKLNPVYHTDKLLESNLQYKLGLYSTPQDEKHKYAISEDLLQYNLTAGVKAFRHWYYSFSLMFKTQILNNYAQNSDERKASFLAPGELNLGLGMTYKKENKKRGIVFQANIAPLSYNLRTCIDSSIDPTQYGVKAGRKSVSQVGSNGELTMTWQLAPNISWRQRLFLFTNYDYFTGDWEHTFDFTINRFLSTQVYIHGRYDTSAPGSGKGWKKWMLKEILSFGFAYSFTTIPPKS